MKRRMVGCAGLLALVMAIAARASVHASVNRDHVAVGDIVTLTIDSDNLQGRPDLSALRKDFQVQGIGSGSQTTIVNGSVHSSQQWTVTLTPTHSGLLEVPPMMVGSEKSQPLKILVDPSSTLGVAGSATSPPVPADQGAVAGSPAFIEDSIDPAQPYVGQAIVYTLRLYYAVPLLDAALDLPTPDNGDARQIGDDERGSQIVQGKRYDVLTRRYLLQPERSGTMHVPAPVFQARTMPDVTAMMDDSLGVGSVRTAGKAIDVTVKPRPAQAGDPWLPAHSITLSIDPLPSALRAGEPFSLTVREDGVGVTAAQLPEIHLPAIAGAQIYPEPSSTIEHARDGSLQAERSRRFAVVPDHAGTLSIPALTVMWWDVVNDRAAVARLAFPNLQVQAAATSARTVPAGSAPAPATGTASESPPAGTTLLVGTARSWQLATLALAVLLALAVIWGWRRGQAVTPAIEPAADAPSRSRNVRLLAQALGQGDPAAIAHALCDVAPDPRPSHLHEVARRLIDPEQRASVQDFEAARWSGDGRPSAAVIARLRAAFARPPQWRAADQPHARDRGLPPLYPD